MSKGLTSIRRKSFFAYPAASSTQVLHFLCELLFRSSFADFDFGNVSIRALRKAFLMLRSADGDHGFRSAADRDRRLNPQIVESHESDRSIARVGDECTAAVSVEIDRMMPRMTFDGAGTDGKSFCNRGILEILVAVGIEINDGNPFLGPILVLGRFSRCIIEDERVMLATGRAYALRRDRFLSVMGIERETDSRRLREPGVNDREFRVLARAGDAKHMIVMSGKGAGAARKLIIKRVAK